MWIYKVVLYDGVNSWVDRFCMREKTADNDIVKYLKEIGSDALPVYLDKQFKIDLETLISYKNSDYSLQRKMYDRFLIMYEF